MTTEKPSDRPSWIKKVGLVGVIITDLFGYTGAGLVLGYLAWAKLGAPWWVLLLLTSTGLGLAMFKLYQISKKEF